LKNFLKKIISASGNLLFYGIKKKINLTEINSALIVSLYYKGDSFFTTKLLPVLSEIIPGVKVDYLVKSRASEMMENIDLVNDVIVFDEIETSDYEPVVEFNLKKKLSLIKFLRNKNYDLCIDLTGKYSTALISLLGGFRYSAGLNYNGFGFCYSKYSETDTQNSPGHLSDKYLNVVKDAFEIEDENWKMILREVKPKCMYRISADENAEAEKILSEKGIDSEKPLITIQTTAGWKAKEWSKEGFSFTVKELMKDYYVVLIGSEKDAEYNFQILDEAGMDLRKFFIVESVRINAAVIGRSDLFIGCDSFGLQIASASGVPAIGLFGPTNPDFSAPDKINTKIIYKKLYCSAPEDIQYCTRNAGKTCETFDCMKAIKPEEVLELSAYLIKQNSLEKAG